MGGFLTIVLGVLLVLLFFWAVAAVEYQTRIGPEGMAALTKFGIVLIVLFLLVGGYLAFLWFTGSL